jgi:hypothetical protein
MVTGGGGDRGVAVWLEQFPDAPGEVALEAAQRLSARLALGVLVREIDGGVGVQARLGDGESVQRAVELAVAAAVEAMAVGAARGCWDRCGRRGARELGVGGEALDAGDFADQLGGGQHAAAALGQQPRRERGDQRRELTLERVDRAG